MAGKLYARVLLVRLQQLAERVYPDSQCTFRTERSTVDMIFSLRQLQEKCREQQKPLFIAFIYLTLCPSKAGGTKCAFNTRVLARASLLTMYTLLRQPRLRWLGHVRRIEDGRIPKDIYGQLALGKKLQGRPQQRYKDVCKRDMKALNINTEIWEDTAAHRSALHAQEIAEDRRGEDLEPGRG